MNGVRVLRRFVGGGWGQKNEKKNDISLFAFARHLGVHFLRFKRSSKINEFPIEVMMNPILEFAK